jgi:serine/threonine protein kinase/tetratricopeptide (TPR) repeat protein
VPVNADNDKSKRQPASGTPEETRDSRVSGGVPGTIDSGTSLRVASDVESAATIPSGGMSMARHSRGIEQPGQVIGHYKLLQEIGEGGFGVVYLAEQEQPVRRRVALKIIKLGMDTKQVIARFEAERQALALMDHPHIAKVLDAGATDTGRPYFVMELVRGVPITEYCNKQNMSFGERLKLFMQVCGAVQHAHQKGIIHRDIKPSNVLVAQVDDKPSPKVIDFGIAKATQARLTEQTMFTEIGQFIGTPAYMSPEQADPVGVDIDTRSDIYSLGVLLYELLTGATPFDSKSLRQAGLDEIKRMIREEDPPRPSTRLSSLGAELDTVARQRAIEPKKLGPLLRGDLDWIIMKALEKDRARRYETANALALDIERYLSGEPVVAAPPSAAYRFQKFVKRNWGTVTACGAVTASLVLGIVAFGWQARIAGAQRDRALYAEEQTRKRAKELKEVADFHAQMLSQVDPTTAGVRLTEDVRARFEATLAKSATPDEQRAAQAELFSDQWSRVNATDAARELIERTILAPAVAAIDKQFVDQPSVAATLRHVLAERYHFLGLDATALALEERVLSDRRRVLGEEHPDTLLAIGNLAVFLKAVGKRKEAEAHHREALEKSRRVRGDDDPETLVCIANLGVLLLETGQLNEAERYAREALERRRRVLGEDDPDTLRSMNDWATLLKEQGKLSEAESFYRDVLAKRRRVLGEEHPHTLASVNDLAVLLRSQGKLDEAVTYFREVTDKRRRILGDTHPSTLTSIQNLGAVLDSTGKSEEAEALMREALEKRRRLLGADHESTLTTLGNLAVWLIGQNRFSEAEPLCRETLERRRRVLGENHAATLVANNVMGLVLIRQGKYAEGEPYWREALAIGRRVLGPTHPETLIYAHNLGGLALDQKKPAEAEEFFREVIDTGGPAIGAGHPTVLSATRRLGSILLEQKRYREAEELLSNAEPAARESYTGSNERSLGAFLKDLGAARTQLDQFRAAESDLIEANAIFVKARGAAHADTRNCTQALIDFYATWDKAEPEKGYDSKAAEWKAKLEAMSASTQPATTAPASVAPTSRP